MRSRRNVTRRSRGVAALIFFMALVGHAAGADAQRLELLVESPDTLAAAATRIRQYDPTGLLSVAWLAGLGDAAAPIRVILAPEESEVADSTSPWIAGFAIGEQDTVVLFPSRTPSYPDDSLEAVLRHEIAHILIARAARQRRVPRWFNEGLATTVEEPWTLEDRTRLVWALLIDGQLSLTALDDRFQQGPRPARRAYALSGALVRDLLQAIGPSAPGRILALVANDLPFDVAFRFASGRSLESATADFWRRQTFWERWLPLVTSPYTLWSAVTLLALVAIWKHRRKRNERRRRWEEEEEEGVPTSSLKFPDRKDKIRCNL